MHNWIKFGYHQGVCTIKTVQFFISELSTDRFTQTIHSHQHIILVL